MYGTSRGTGHKRAQRFQASGYPDRLGGCQGMTHRVGLALSAQRHAHCEILVSHACPSTAVIVTSHSAVSIPVFHPQC